MVALLFIANTINVAADLGAMADAIKLLIGGHAIVYVLVLRRDLGGGADLPRLQALCRGAEMADAEPVRLCRRACLCPCVLGRSARRLAVPHITWSADYFTTIVAILGTTISPYLFFWQASQEAEDQRVDATKQPLIEKHYGARKEFHRIRADTIVGMAFSNLIALSIIVTAAATLHAAGKTDIQTSAQAAEALRRSPASSRK